MVLTLTGLLIGQWVQPLLAWSSLLAYVLGAGLIADISYHDDRHTVPNRVRFGFHTLGAVFALVAFGYWTAADIPLLGPVPLSYVGLPITFLWIVGLTNAYNFMDGIDGLAGSQAVVAGLGWMVIGVGHGQRAVALLGLLIVASSLGFLGHNWSPARIFMGDVGSAFLGFSFAVLPLLAGSADLHGVLVGPLLVWPFVFDSVFTFIRRLRRGERVFAAHRSHLYQRLVIAGHGHRFVTMLYSGLALVGVGLAVAWDQGMVGNELLIMVVLPVLAVGLWRYVVRRERWVGTHSD